jgi:hypothetical protein
MYKIWILGGLTKFYFLTSQNIRERHWVVGVSHTKTPTVSTVLKHEPAVHQDRQIVLLLRCLDAFTIFCCVRLWYSLVAFACGSRLLRLLSPALKHAGEFWDRQTDGNNCCFNQDQAKIEPSPTPTTPRYNCEHNHVLNQYFNITLPQKYNNCRNRSRV